MMPEIRILSDQVANQIAAGEVVERPVAVLKELVENSIDAGAGKIEIEFRNGGKSYLRVEDDGCGMKPDQALLALERHATSKIRQAADLNKIVTFGFRGEAIPSIASVSRFVLRSRARSVAQGTEILVNGGKMIHCKDCGMPNGTRVEVSHLFNSVPGRRKFLKTEVTETTHLVHMAKLYALAHPAISFTLIEGGRTIFRSPATEKSCDRVREIFGRSLSDSLLPVQAADNEISMTGFLGKPGQSRATRKEMIFYVNRRPVESKTLSYAVLEGFHTFVPKGRFPPAILFLEIDPSLVDVNVHPSKREVRFRNEVKVRSFLLNAVLDHNGAITSSAMESSASKHGVEYELEDGMLVPKMDLRALELYGLENEGDRPMESTPFATKADSHLLQATRSGNFHSQIQARKSAEILPEKLVGKRLDPSAKWRFLDRVHGDLVLFSTPQGMVALHIRATYERVRFEQLEESLRVGDGAKTTKQALLSPEPLEVDGIDRSILESSLPKLRKLGFILEEFGRNFYRMETCPGWLDPALALSYLKDFLEIARENEGSIQVETFARLALERLSNYTQETRDEFTDEEIIDLVDRLLRSRNQYVCPKGRPTYFEIPKRDFEARFKRKL